MLAPLTKTTPAAEPCYSRAKHNRVSFAESRCSLAKTSLLQNHSILAQKHNRVLSQITMLVLFLTKTTPAAEPYYAGAENNPILSQITMLFGKNKPAAESFYPRGRHNRILSQITMLFPFDKNKPAAKPCYSRAKHNRIAEPFYSRAQNNPILSQITTLSPLAQTTLLQDHSSLALRTILLFRKSRCYPLWQEQPCCRTILT